MYADLQRQVEFYVGESGQSNVMVAPPDYMPAYLAEPELSEEEWLEYHKDILEGDTSGSLLWY